MRGCEKTTHTYRMPHKRSETAEENSTVTAQGGGGGGEKKERKKGTLFTEHLHSLSPDNHGIARARLCFR